jgi:hypothetical protein
MHVHICISKLSRVNEYIHAGLTKPGEVGDFFRNMGAPFMWILKKKYDYWWKKYGLEKTDRATKTLLFDRNWASSLKPRRRSRPPRLVWWAILIDFRKSPRFSLISPLSQERERSQVALFLLCVVSPEHVQCSSQDFVRTGKSQNWYEKYLSSFNKFKSDLFYHLIYKTLYCTVCIWCNNSIFF